MKLPEADFRPKRRVGYVPSGPQRKIPVVRILLLLIAAVLVYREFDAFWPKLRALTGHSTTEHQITIGNVAWIYSADSSHAVLNCSHFKEADYCPMLEQLQPRLCSQVRAVFKKAAWLGALNNPVLSRVQVHIPAVLWVLEGQDHAGKFHYERANEDPSSAFCDSVRGCLSPPSPRLPLERGRLGTSHSAMEDTLSHWTSTISPVFPVLPGKVIFLDSLGPENYRALLYHGNELYTSYEGLGRLTAGLKVGALVDPMKSIGNAAPVDSLALSDSSKYRMSFRVEQAGMFLDPSEFLSMEDRKSNGR